VRTRYDTRTRHRIPVIPRPTPADEGDLTRTPHVISWSSSSGGARLLGVEEAGGVLRGQGDGQVPNAVAVIAYERDRWRRRAGTTGRRQASHFLAFTSIACTLICYRRRTD
jgi:hypothetical protein